MNDAAPARLWTPSPTRIESAGITRYRHWLEHMERLMGVLLVLTGIAFLTGAITTASFWLLEMFPALGRIG